MPRKSTKEVKKLMYQIGVRDGFGCHNKKRKHHSPMLVLDHIDNNESNYEKSNLQLLCQGCNVRKNPRGKGRRGIRVAMRVSDLNHRKNSLVSESVSVCVRESESDKSRAQSREMEKSEACEPAFREWFGNMVDMMDSILVSDVVNGGAEAVGCSQATVRRYLDKLCSFTGQYEYFEEEGKRFVREKISRLPDSVMNTNGDGGDHGSFPGEEIAGQN